MTSVSPVSIFFSTGWPLAAWIAASTAFLPSTSGFIATSAAIRPASIAWTASAVASTPTTQHLAGEIARGDRLDGAERHLVVRGENRAQVGIARQQVLHHRHAEGALAVGGLHRDESDSGCGGDSVLEAGEAVFVGGDAENTANHRDFALSAEKLRDVLAGQLAGMAIIRADVGDFAGPVDVRVHDDDRNAGGLRLFEHRHDLRHTGGRNREGRHLLRDLVFQDRDLLVDIDLALRGEDRQADGGVGFRGIVRAGFDALPPFAVERFSDQRNLDAFRLFSAAAGRRNRGGDQNQPDSSIHLDDYNAAGK